MSEKLPNASEEEILNAIAQLQSEGKLRVSPQPPMSPKLSAYLRTGQALWFWITLVCTLSSMGTVFLVPPDSGPIVIVRNVLGVLFILWFPGYTLVKALFPTSTRSTRTSEKDMDIVERVAMSLGLSLALVPIVGLLLNYTPWGITLIPIVLSLTALTLLLATVALLRESQTRNKQEQPQTET